jgi:hypothetical protein
VYDEDDADEVDVISDFSLEEKVVDSGYGWHNDTKKLMASGTVGSGKNKIRIETVGGKVYLKKR